jgi:hypothetical protein
VHARCLVEHLPDPASAVTRLAAALRPGGWLVLETFDMLWDQLPAWPAYPASGQAAVTPVYRALLEHLHVVDSRGGRSMIEHLYACRLEGIGGQLHANLADRHGANRWLRLNVERFENELLAAGALTKKQIASFYAFHDQPGAWMNPPLQVSVRGQRPHQRA